MNNAAHQDVKVKIRRAVEADRDTLIKLIVRAYEDVRERQSGEVLARIWHDWEAHHVCSIDVDRVVLAELAGKAVGFASYEGNAATGIGIVDDNGVLPEYRGRGIGAQLLAQILQLLEDAGMEYNQVSTGLDSTYFPARRMYERQGFVPLHRGVTYIKKLAQNAG